jgi:hypothetical protein
MVKLALVFLLALGMGYSYGYHKGAAGAPSVMQVVMGKFGVYKIQARQRNRERATDAVTR